MLAQFLWILDPIFPPHQLRKNAVTVGPPLKKLSGSAYDYNIHTKGNQKSKVKINLYPEIRCNDTTLIVR